MATFLKLRMIFRIYSTTALLVKLPSNALNWKSLWGAGRDERSLATWDERSGCDAGACARVLCVEHERMALALKRERGGTHMKKKNIGSSFDSWLRRIDSWLRRIDSWLRRIDSWLRRKGIYEEMRAGALKRVLARQVEAAMKDNHFRRRRWRGGCTPAGPHSTGCSIRTMTR